MLVSEKDMKNLAAKYHVRAERKFGRVYLYTKFEEFYFEESGSPYVRLMHYNRSAAKNEYHEQFVKEMSLEQVFVYVVQHTKAKYTNKYVRFSV